jgi:phosphatidyl-myo-inositol dimannoside synthase
LKPGSPRILLVLSDAPGSAGGIARYNLDLLRGLCEQGWIADVIFRATRQLSNDTGLVVSSWRSATSLVQFFFHLLATIWRRPAPQVVFAGHINYALPALWLARLLRAKFCLQLHGIEAWRPLRISNTFAARRADCVLAVSRFTRRQFLRWSAVREERVRVLPNTVADLPVVVDKQLLRSQLNIPATVPVLLTIGRLNHLEQYKGQDRVLAAIPQLLLELPTLQYWIAGDGDDRARLEQICSDNGIEKHVRFLGALAQDDLRTYLGAADLMVMPSTGEGFGIVYLEAMAAGTPAMGLALDGSVDPLAEGDLGITATHDFAQTILSALRAPQLTGAALSIATQKRFGRTQFSLTLGHILKQEFGSGK